MIGVYLPIKQEHYKNSNYKIVTRCTEYTSYKVVVKSN